MRKVTFVFIFFMCGCTTPSTVLKNNETGQIAQCGGNVSGSLAGGVIGYNIQKSNDEKCVQNYKEQGFNIVDKR